MTDDHPPPSEVPGTGLPHRRLWTLAAGALAVGFVVLVTGSTQKAAVPVGSPSSMTGMSMSAGAGGHLRLTMRGLDHRTVRVPGGRPGVAVFVELRGCDACRRAVRDAARAIEGTSSTATLLVISADSATDSAEVAAFARSAGQPDANYVIDDRSGSIASAFGASALGAAVVYDAGGRVRARVAPGAGGLWRVLQRAGG